MTITAIIPARGGSKGIPGKNLRLILGVPLISRSIAQALESGKVDRVLVSTDSEEIAHVARLAGAEVPGLRPAALAGDETPTEPVLVHALEHWCSPQADDPVVLLQPTSPLRLPGSIDSAIEAFLTERADSLVSVCETHAFFWRNLGDPVASYDYSNRPRRQDILPEHLLYRENGSIYIVKAGVLLEHKCRVFGRIILHRMSECESYEIDSETDFQIVEELLRRNGF